MKLLLTATILTLATATATPGAAKRAQLSFDKAVDVCTTRAIRYGRTLHGRDADEPSAQRVQDQYRACVYAYSRQYPTRKVKYRSSIFNLQKIVE